MFKKRWLVVNKWNGTPIRETFTKKRAQEIVSTFNSMAKSTGYEVRFEIKDTKKGSK